MRLGEWDARSSLGFRDTNGSPNFCHTTRLFYSQRKKERACRIVDFAVLLDHRILIKESEKRDKYVDLARKLTEAIKPEGDGDANCNWCTWNKS